MDGKMLCTNGLRDVTTARKVLGSRVQAVLWAGDSLTCNIMFSTIMNLKKDGVYRSSQTNAFIRHEMPEIKRNNKWKEWKQRHEFSQTNCRKWNDRSQM